MAVSVSHNIRMVFNDSIDSFIGHKYLDKKIKRQQQQFQQKKKKNFISRTIAIEQAYVHDVYSVIATNPDFQIISPVRSYVKQFLLSFEPGSILLDIGCSDGQHINLSPNVVVVGMEHCPQWFQHNNYKLCPDPKYLLLGNVLYLPFRDEFFDGILCCSVLHHLSTLERRIKALKEIARIMKIGGRILLTVTSCSMNDKEIQSQDVLIKVNNLKKYARSHNESEVNFQSYIASNSNTSTEDPNNGLSTYETYNSPSNSELENCYSFFKKAIKRFSLASSIYPFKNSFEESTIPSKVLDIDDYPIELRNLDDEKLSCHSSKSPSTDVDSALSSFNRSSGCISQTSSNTMFPTSILSAIKEHLISWKTQFTNSFEHWQSFEINDSTIDGGSTKNSFYRIKRDQMYHRFSLPISFWRANKQDSLNSNSVATKNKLAKNKIYVSNGFEKTMMLPFVKDGQVHKDFCLNELLKQNVSREIQHTCSNIKTNQIISTKTKKIVEQQEENKSFATRNNRILFQKSFSSESLQPTSVHCCQFKLLAYYSMPELSTLFALSKKELHSFRIYQEDKITTNSYKDENSQKKSKQVEQFTTNEMSKNVAKILNENSEQQFLPDKVQDSESNIKMDKSSVNEVCPKAFVVSKPKAFDVSKFTKKLLRQRSFSADYQPEAVKLQPDPPRRFSASPNIETHRYNNADHIPHHQQISMDSEESFVTIIPANRSTRESFNYSDNMTDFDLEEDECTSNQVISPNEIYSYSSEEEQAYCESFENDQNTSNDTSISSVLEATIKSISRSESVDSQNDEITTISSIEDISRENFPITSSSSSSSSPPTTLHQYYHLFRNGELEQMIEEHVQNLHVIDSFYNECAMSWCVVAEKIHVWTI